MAAWYKQKAYGFKRLVAGEDFLWVSDVNTRPDHRQGAADFSERVGELFSRWEFEGWTGWTGAECPLAQAGAGDFWIWSYDGAEKRFEILFFGTDAVDTDAELEENLSLHKGRGWRFPLMVVFQDEPPQHLLDILQRHKVPYAVGPEYFNDVPGGDASDDPEPPDDEDLQDIWDTLLGIKNSRQRLESKVDFLAEHLFGIEP